MIRITLAVNSAVLSSARSAPPMLLLAFSPPDEKSHISPCCLWLFSTHGFFLPSILQRVSRRFGAVCIFFSVTVLAVSHRQNGYLSPGKREARRRVLFLLLSFRPFRVYGTLRQCMFHRGFGYTTRATREPPLGVGSCGKKQDAMEPLALSVHGFRHVLCSAGFGAARVRQK